MRSQAAPRSKNAPGPDQGEQSIKSAAHFIREWLSYWVPRSGLPGLSVAIRLDDKLILNKAWGKANLKTGEKLTPKHVFRVASQSKMFTATAIGILKDRGVLDFDDKASNFLPWMRKHKDLRDITIRELLGHTAGVLRDGVDSRFWVREFPFPNRRKLEEAQAIPAARRPADSIKYSNWGYGLLGEIVEAASGQSYSRFVTDNIIKPLHLHRTQPDYTRHTKEMLVTGHGEAIEGARSTRTPRIPTNALAAATGLCSTPADLTRFMLNRAGKDGVLKPATEKALCAHFNNVARAEDFTYGLGHERLTSGGYVYNGHGGSFSGQLTQTYTSKKLGLSISVAANANDLVSVRALTKAMAKAVTNYLDEGISDEQPANGGFAGKYGSNWVCFDRTAGKAFVLPLESDDPWDSDNRIEAEALHPGGRRRDYTITGDSGFGNIGETFEFQKTKRGPVMLDTGYRLKRG
jgi:D-alanyl-D-alanine carboxypeptidase